MIHLIPVIYTVDRPPIKIYSDASATGLGAHVKINDKMLVAKHTFTSDKKIQSSTWRELYAINFSLHSFILHLKNQNVLYHTDNMAATTILKSGSSKIELQHFSESVFNLCKSNNITFNVLWVPRDFLSYADGLSKSIDYDDWETEDSFFQLLDQKWGPFTLDCFADHANAKTKKFYSRYYCPSSSGVNAFHFTWQNDMVFLVPPVHLIPDTVRHIETYLVKGVLLVPYWPSALFYPLLFHNDSLKAIFSDSIYFDESQPCFKVGKSRRGVIGSPEFSSGVLALRLR